MTDYCPCDQCNGRLEPPRGTDPLEAAYADPEGLALVQAILDRKASQ